MTRRASLFITAATLVAVAGCATVSPTQRSIGQAADAQQSAPQQADRPQAAPARAPQIDQSLLLGQAMAQRPIPAQLAGTLRAGMPLATSPLVAGAMPIPPLGTLATAIPAAIPAPGTSILATFPTLAFGFRWVDIYTPLWATSARTLAIAGLPPGFAPSILSRLHWLGINSHFGIYAPFLHWNGVYRPFFITHPHHGVNYFPFAAGIGGGMLSPFFYRGGGLPGAYAAAGPLPVGALGAACGPVAVGACPGLGTTLGAPGLATSLGTTMPAVSTDTTMLQAPSLPSADVSAAVNAQGGVQQ